jgi:hypothetical protein
VNISQLKLRSEKFDDDDDNNNNVPLTTTPPPVSSFLSPCLFFFV